MLEISPFVTYLCVHVEMPHAGRHIVRVWSMTGPCQSLGKLCHCSCELWRDYRHRLDESLEMAKDFFVVSDFDLRLYLATWWASTNQSIILRSFSNTALCHSIDGIHIMLSILNCSRLTLFKQYVWNAIYDDLANFAKRAVNAMMALTASFSPGLSVSESWD